MKKFSLLLQFIDLKLINVNLGERLIV